MSHKTKHFYDFGDFRLDSAEKLLLRDGKPISITPKVFETLCALLENAGRLMEKDELMRRIWQDRFVEENNLTFNIKMLRKALGDCANKPEFIETVPRRGYRFIAEVRETFPETERNFAPVKTFPPPRKSTEDWFSLSPDDRQISFVRCNHGDDDYCSLLTADADGRNERKLVTRARPVRIGDNQFSPDGKSIAFAAGQSWNRASDFRLMRIDK